MHIMQSRRDFLATLSAAGAAGVLGGRRVARQRGAAGNDHDPDRQARRNLSGASIPGPRASGLKASPTCAISNSKVAPSCSTRSRVVRSDFDYGCTRQISSVRVDAGLPLTVLAGVHPGRFEPLAHEPIQTVSDLKGKKVGIQGLGSNDPGHARRHHGGARGARSRQGRRLDHRSIGRADGAVRRGKVDAFLGFPPEPQELRARKIGHVIVNRRGRSPWSQYFCCMLAGNREFVAIIRSRPSACRAPSSRPPTSAPPSRSEWRNVWSMMGLPSATTTRSRR